MGRVEGGAAASSGYIKYLLILVALCFAVWATPRSIIATVSEIARDGRGLAPALGYLGVMSAKNTAVNILILDHLRELPALPPHREASPTVSWARLGNRAQLAIFAAAAVDRRLPRRATATSSRRRCASGSRCRRSARCSSRWSR